MRTILTINLLCLSLIVSICAFAQRTPGKEYYSNGNIMSQTTYNNITHKWKVTEYYLDGSLASEKTLKNDGVSFIDTLKAFYGNGKPVYFAIFKDNSLTGNFTQFYANGNIQKKGEYYNHFKTGVWTEYYENGKKKSEGRYCLTKRDSLIKDPSFLSNRIKMDTISYPDIAMDKYNSKRGNLTPSFRKDMLMTITTLKEGYWYTWDEKGTIISKENYSKGKIIPEH